MGPGNRGLLLNQVPRQVDCLNLDEVSITQTIIRCKLTIQKHLQTPRPYMQSQIVPGTTCDSAMRIRHVDHRRSFAGVNDLAVDQLH